MKGDVINYQRVIFGEIDTGHLAILTCYKTHLIHTIALNFECPHIFDAPMIGRHKTFMCLLPYLLFVHIGELLANSLLPFSLRLFVRMIPGFIECLGLIQNKFATAGGTPRG